MSFIPPLNTGKSPQDPILSADWNFNFDTIRTETNAHAADKAAANTFAQNQTMPNVVLTDAGAGEFFREGTITNLTFVGSTIPGSPTYITRHATWRRVGPLVHVGFEVNISNLGGLEGNVSIGNVLPFAVLSATGYWATMVPRTSSIALSTNYTTHIAYAIGTSLALNQIGNNIGAVNVTHAEMTNTARVFGSIDYITGAA